MTEEELQAALFAELDADLEADLAKAQAESRSRRDDCSTTSTLSDVGRPVLASQPRTRLPPRTPPERASYGKGMTWTTCWPNSGWEPTKGRARPGIPTSWPGGLRGCAFAEVEPHAGDLAREQAQASDYVGDRQAPGRGQRQQHGSREPYQGFSLDVGWTVSPRCCRESSGFDVDADDGGVGAKLDLAALPRGSTTRRAPGSCWKGRSPGRRNQRAEQKLLSAWDKGRLPVKRTKGRPAGCPLSWSCSAAASTVWDFLSPSAYNPPFLSPASLSSEDTVIHAELP